VVITSAGMEDGEHLFRLEDFATVRELGAGTQGVVNEVVHTKSGEHFAMKMQAVQLDEEGRKRQLLELKTLRKSRHANVVALYDAFYKEGYLYTLLELMDRGTLQAIVGKAAVPEAVLGKIVMQIVDGLAYIHKEFHVLHRDVKPANILLNSRGEVKLSDFGVIGRVENTVGNATTFTGSSAYMSPERLKDAGHRMNSDCWSVGMIVLECALGYFPLADPPVEGGKVAPLSVFHLMERVASADPTAALERIRFSDPFNDFCRQCLIRDPDLRPSSTALAAHPWVARSRADKATDLKKWLAK
jgi:serine/threonine protein kinase